MARPRKTGEDLPERVYQRRGTYYYAAPTGRWISLGKDKALALRKHGNVANTEGGLLKHLRGQVWVTTKNNAKTRKREFSLTPDDLVAMATANDWKCAVTGIPFSILEAKTKRRPYAPSVDRIDCSNGYTKNNCRLVCFAVNMALSDWGESVFEKMMLFYARRMWEEKYGSTSNLLDVQLDEGLQHTECKQEKMPQR